MRSGFSCGALVLGGGISSFTAWFCTGSVRISITSNTSITSMSGVVLTSHIGSSEPPEETFMLIGRKLLSAARCLALGLGQELHFDDAGGLDGVERARHVLVARIAVGLHVHLR